MISVLALVGPTGSGKTALSLPLCEQIGGEIVAMDSMQVYRGMDVGTAKPTAAERARVPHHLLDVASPGEAFSVSDYVRLASSAIEDIHRRGRLPVLVGGTGFYLRALTQGLTLGGAKGDASIRARLESIAAEPDGKLRLHQALSRVDADAAARLHPNDVRRVVRALEVFELTGVPFSRQQANEPPCPYRLRVAGVRWQRDTLYARIDRRVDEMMAQGLLEEVRGLLESGVPETSQAMQGIGYKELAPVVAGLIPLPDAVACIRQNTRHYAKRQMTWFRADKRVVWLEGEDERAPDKLRALANEIATTEDTL